MFSKLRKRITYANVTVTAAFVFALTGGAYAAGKYIITSKSQIKPSVIKQLQSQGKAGPAGTAGPAGPAGPAGTAGGQGLAGAAGANGTDGTNGGPGESVTTAELKPGSPCSSGGVEFKVGGKATHACNGATGYTKTLPEHQTETGAWTMSPVPVQFRCVAAPEEEVENNVTHIKEKVHTGHWEDSACLSEAPENPAFGKPVGDFEREELAHTKGSAFASISFPIPLSKPLSETAVHYIKESETTAQCAGSPEAPSAEPGNLCVYERFTSGLKTDEPIIFPPSAGFFGIPTEQGAGVSGAGVYLPMPAGKGGGIAIGAWAVTEG